MNIIPLRHYHMARLFAVLSFFLFGTHLVSAETTDPGGGIGGTGITGFGVVQKFGSIFVNGREFFLNENTRIARDGAPANEKALHLGDVVRVEGRVDPVSGRSIATRVDAALALQGVVERVDAASGTLTVLGQSVHVTPGTRGEGVYGMPLLDRMRRGEHVAISGLVRSNGSWTATRIAPAATGESGFVLRGLVQKIDPERGRLRVAGQEMIASSGTLSAPLAVGNEVRVVGRYDNSVLRLESVVPARIMLGLTGGVVEMSGYVQALPGAGRLVSNGVELHYSVVSSFIGGTADDLRKDVPVAVRGELQADGSVSVRALLINVEPMRVSLPEFDASAPHGDIGNAPNQKHATDAPERNGSEMDRPEVEGNAIAPREKPDIEKPDIEKPDIEKPDIQIPDIQIPDIQGNINSNVNQ